MEGKFDGNAVTVGPMEGRLLGNDDDDGAEVGCSINTTSAMVKTTPAFTSTSYSIFPSLLSIDAITCASVGRLDNFEV
jgi:hypothetical protein